MKDYVCGFLFDEKDNKKVVLIRKNRPDWQKGLLNGVGGKVEPNETIPEAMSREFEEETGVKIPAEKWIRFCNLEGRKNEYNENDTWTVWFYYTIGDISEVKTMTDEQVLIYHLSLLEPDYNCVPNLSWIIPLAQAKNIQHPITIYSKK